MFICMLLPATTLPKDTRHKKNNIYIYILDPHEAPYGACKSYKAEFEEVCVFVFLRFGVFVCVALLCF